MLSIPYLLLFLVCGVIIVRMLLPRQSPLARLWLGMSLGVLLMMWLPALLAMACRFTLQAHLLALIPLVLITGCAWLGRDRHLVRGWDAEEKVLLRQVLIVTVPLTILGGYLQYTHCLQVDEWGNLNVGQSTYGDLAMHLSFITNLVDSAFPPDYPFFPGVQLSYPFLTDSLSSSFLLLGCSLQLCVVLPGTLMMALCYTGVVIMARDMTRGRKTVVLAALFFFLNGGLGFLYDFDLAGGTEWNGTPVIWTRIQEILNGYYKTPTNQPDPNNLRWSNLIADLMIPQRTLLGGYCMVIPCFYLLYSAFDPEQRREKGGLRTRILLGIWAGALPLIHTHSFLALGLCSAGMLIYDLIHEKEERWRQLGCYLQYAAIAVVLAVPQLVLFTFRQVFMEGGDSQSFIRFHFNWVNNTSDSGLNLRDLYFWFYIKNIGLPFIALILALFEKDRHSRRLFAGAIPIILAVELVRFQPNIYDNNKLMYLAWLLCCMIAADWCDKVWHRLKGMRSRPFIAVCTAVVVFLSAGLTLWRECVSTYQAFSYSAAEAGEWVRDNTEKDAVFLSGTQHLNPVSSLAGRTTVCGPDLWLYWHGINTTERKYDIARFYNDPENNQDVLEKYGVDYIMVSSYERSDTSFEVDRDALERLYTVVFENWEMTIYRVDGIGQQDPAALSDE